MAPRPSGTASCMKRPRACTSATALSKRQRARSRRARCTRRGCGRRRRAAPSAHALLERAQQRDARRQDRGLLELGAAQLVLRALEAERARAGSRARASAASKTARAAARRLVDVAAHADLLGPLPGKEQRQHRARSVLLGLDHGAAAVVPQFRHTRCGSARLVALRAVRARRRRSAWCARRWSRRAREVRLAGTIIARLLRSSESRSPRSAAKGELGLVSVATARLDVAIHAAARAQPAAFLPAQRLHRKEQCDPLLEEPSEVDLAAAEPAGLELVRETESVAGEGGGALGIRGNPVPRRLQDQPEPLADRLTIAREAAAALERRARPRSSPSRKTSSPIRWARASTCEVARRRPSRRLRRRRDTSRHHAGVSDEACVRRACR